MLLHFLENIGIVMFMLSLIVMIYMVLCRKYSHFKGLNEQEDKHFTHAFINRLYFVLTTIATIGYGDISPASMRARIITICVILTVFVIVLKAFDSIINTYNVNLSSYVSSIKNFEPINYLSGREVTTENKK